LNLFNALKIHSPIITTHKILKSLSTLCEDIFLLTDYILKGQKDLALLEFKKLSTNKHYLEILAVLQTNFSKLASIKVDSVSLNSFEIASKTKLPEFVVKKQLEKLKNVPMDKIIKIRENLLQAEYRVKTGEISFGASRDGTFGYGGVPLRRKGSFRLGRFPEKSNG
jgi:DNA polymerase III delta subunit